MSRGVEGEVAELLAEAEEGGRCLVLRGRGSARVYRALERRVAAGTVVSPARGLYVSAGRWEGLKTDQRTMFLARGLQEKHPDWVFCGPTAAVAYGVDVSWSLQGNVHVATTRGGHSPNGTLVHRHPILRQGEGTSGIEVVGGLRVTGPERTMFDCLRRTDFPRGLGMIDSALRSGVVSREEFAAYVESVRDGSRGKDLVRGTLAWADPRSENGGESIARARMLLLGFACPELQVEVPNLVEGGAPFRADYCWVRADGVVILGELDGTDKYVVDEMTRGRSLDEVLSDEKNRESRISLYNVVMMRFRFGLTDDPVAFAEHLDRHGVPRRGSELALPDGTGMVPDWESIRRVC